MINIYDAVGRSEYVTHVTGAGASRRGSREPTMVLDIDSASTKRLSKTHSAAVLFLFLSMLDFGSFDFCGSNLISSNM